ncbi:NADH--cytochrome b5 reductase 1-like [Amaranthus tricolor]|uniref:NADH--cytochrome b5 reductase 1-like n=1 Tax=Amaranthus tricolor TaxID=29722 RepID=UPI00258D47DC|nr:NADH--cytochrome b5 reductase 1-like [Amaranthus tricolor]
MLTTLQDFLLNSTYKQLFSHLFNSYFLKSFTHDYILGIVVALFVVLVATISFFVKRKPKGCLDPKRYKEFMLIQRTKVSHNTDIFRFALPMPKSILGLPVGQHIKCRGKDSEGEEVVRSYTPITLDSDIGYFELLVKMYPQGRMSHHFRQMRKGDFLPVIGPKGRFKYQPGKVRAFGMLAGGTGITPMFQITRAILENPKDLTKIHLIYANKTADDILLKEDLDGFASKYPDRFKVYYVVSEPPPNWDAGIGHISKEMIQEHCPRPSADVMILRCGPPGMNKATEAYLNELGYTSEMQFQF